MVEKDEDKKVVVDGEPGEQAEGGGKQGEGAQAYEQY